MIVAVAGCGSNNESNKQPNDNTVGIDQYKDVEVSAEELLKNVNARKAISMAFDKSYITDEILKNGSMPADYLVPLNLASDADGNDFRDKYPNMNEFNSEEALDYWNTAKEELEFGKVTIQLLTYDTDSSKKISEFIQGQLEKNLPGLAVKLNQQPFENKLELAKNGEFDIDLSGWGPDYPDPMTFLDLYESNGGHNDPKYNNPEYDENIKRTKSGDLVTDIEARWELLQETEKILLDDAVIAPVYQRGRSIVAQPYFSGMEKHNFGGDYTFKTADTTKIVDGEKVINLSDTSDIPSMDTNKATDTVSFQAMANVNEGLYMLGVNDIIEPGVATNYDVSEDGLTYTFTLREDATWSNGDSIGADDFVYAWRRLGNPDTGAEYAYMLETAGIKNANDVITGEKSVEELGVKAIDEYTLEVTLETPVPYFINMMTFPSFYPLNEEFVEAQGDKYGTSIETTLYNGPFVLSKWEIGYEFEYAKNPDYYNADSVKIDRVNFRIIKDVATDVNLYETGEIDRIRLSGEFVEQYMDDPNFFLEGETVLFYLQFNINNR